MILTIFQPWVHPSLCASAIPGASSMRGTYQKSMVLMETVKQILKERGLSDEAANWIVQDISPRLSFLDGSFPGEKGVKPPGRSSIFAAAITKAFYEMILLETELYYEKSRHKDFVAKDRHPAVTSRADRSTN
jgi:hypothetical protein